VTAQNRWKLADRRVARIAPPSRAHALHGRGAAKRAARARRVPTIRSGDAPSVESFEVRAVNRHGQGLGSDRHATAIPIPTSRCAEDQGSSAPTAGRDFKQRRYAVIECGIRVARTATSTTPTRTPSWTAATETSRLLRRLQRELR
jgi:hypothetical protein